MSEFLIKDEDLTSLKGKVVVLTGGSSGIGLATVTLLLSLGASVVSGDLNAPKDLPASPAFTFVQTNVAIWSDLRTLFKTAHEHHSRIDYVFANAGIGPRADYLSLAANEAGELQEPSHELIDVSLKGVINTAVLGVHYMKTQKEGGNIVLMGSSTGLQPLRAPDYSTAKHGVLGFGRGYARLLDVASIPIRVNTLMPSWTNTSVIPSMEVIMPGISQPMQTPLIVARAAVYLMATKERQGEAVYVADGKYTEIEKSVLYPAYEKILGEGNKTDDKVLENILAFAAQAAAAGQ
ncbi:hypothetical protein VE03_03653 [Pseudogymnoascus sp. 23342-1-I1]|nr:hypothetical protein VE03_03600 [Pseudogymnoascus sp. 23342-1-I1]OBT66587.1 hypothetical protein VE03_03653 [Pseudogymnoascus sp. 23342-1-I1]